MASAVDALLDDLLSSSDDEHQVRAGHVFPGRLEGSPGGHP